MDDTRTILFTERPPSKKPMLRTQKTLIILQVAKKMSSNMLLRITDSIHHINHLSCGVASQCMRIYFFICKIDIQSVIDTCSVNSFINEYRVSFAFEPLTEQTNNIRILNAKSVGKRIRR